MPLDEDATKQFKALIKLAKSNPLPFGLALGKKPEDSAFVLDKKKPYDLLLKEAKKAPGVDKQKSCCGTVSVEGSKLFLRCADDPPTGIVKKLKIFLKANKLTLKPIVTSPDGQEFEAEPDEDADAAQQGDGATDAAEGLMDRLKEIATQAATLPEEAAAKIQAGLKGAFQAIKGGDAEGAAGRLDKVEEAIAALRQSTQGDESGTGDSDTAPDVDPELLAKWQAASAKIAPLVKEAIDRGVGEIRKIEAVWNLANQKIADGDYSSALKAVPMVAKLLSAARALEDEGAAEEENAAKKEEASREQQAWDKVAAALGALVDRLAAANATAGPKVKAAWDKAVKAAEDGSYADALEIAKKVRAALQKLGPLEAAGPQGSAPEQPQRADTAETGQTSSAPPNKPLPPTPDEQPETTASSSPPNKPLPPTPGESTETTSAPTTSVEDEETSQTTTASEADEAPQAEPAAVPALEEVDLSTLADHPGLAAARAGYEAVAKKAAAFGDKVPGDWVKTLGSVDGELRPAPGTETGVIDAAIASTEKELATLETDIAKLIADRKVWETQSALMSARLSPIEVHFAASKEPVKTELADLVKEFGKTKKKAEAFDFAGASGEIPALLAKGDVLEALADDLAHYLAIHDDRKKRIDALAPATGQRHGVDDPRDEAVSAFAEAEKKAKKKDYEAAVELLLKVPELCDQFVINVRRYKEYSDESGALNLALQEIDRRPEPHRALVTDAIARLHKLYDESRLSETDDLLLSARMLNRDVVSRERSTVLKLLDEVRDYQNAFDQITKDIDDLNAHDGREVIEDVIDRLDTDRVMASSSAITRKFPAAIKILLSSVQARADAKTLADDFVAYRDKKKTVDKTLTDLKARDKAGAAAVPVGNAEANIAKAEEYRVARDFKAGTARLEAAEASLATAKSLLDMADEKKKAVGDGADPSQDIVAAMKAYEAAKTYVDGKAGAEFDALIANADALAAEARTASTGAQTPETTKTVTDKLAEAHKVLDGVIEKIACKDAYDTLLADLDTAIKGGGTLEGVNTHDCIKTEITALKAEKTAIEALVVPAKLDFAAATTRLQAALRDVQAAEKKAGVYVDLNRAFGVLKRAEIDVRAKSVAARTKMASLTDLQCMKTAADDLKTKYMDKVLSLWRTDNKPKEALALVKKGEALGKSYQQLAVPMEDAAADVTRLWINNTAAVRGHANIAGVQADLDTLLLKQAQVTALLDAHAFKAVAGFVNENADNFVRLWNIMADRAPYEASYATAKTKVEAAEAASTPPVVDSVAKLRARLTEAEQLADPKKLYKAAKKITDALPAECDTVIAEAGKYTAFDDLRKAARAKLDDAAADAESITVRPLLDRLSGKWDNASEIGEKGDFNKANAMLTEIPGEVDAAMARAGSNAELDAAAKDAADVGDWDTMRAALDKVNKLRGDFAKTAEAQFLVERMVALTNACAKCDEKIDEGNPFIAKEALDEAIEHCKWIQLNIGYFEQVMSLTNRAVQDITKRLENKPFVADDFDALISEIDEGMTLATETGQVAEATTRIEAAMDKSHEAFDLAERHQRFMERQAQVATALELLFKHEHRYGIKEEIDRAKALMDSAGAAAAGRDHDTAEKEIGEAETLVLDAKVEADMLANKPPEEADIKAILARPDGDKALDKLVAGLDAQAKRKVLRVAFEARFGCELNIYAKNTTQATDKDGNLLWYPDGSPAYVDDLSTTEVADLEKQGPNIERFYEVMSALPKGHTMDNDSMLEFGTEDIDGPKGSYYMGGDKKEVVMREGDARTSVVYGFGQPQELGEDVEDVCKPANDDRVDFFSWNTLHEVGHAVDDKHGFMSSRMGSGDFGNWTEYADPMPIAKAISGAYDNYDVNYILQYMTGASDPPIPDCPANAEADRWETARLRVRAHVDAARVGNNPWSTDAVAKKLNIGGIVYHESYAGNWKSYAYASRKQGISGYQFRAPGEWFSELYAAYHSKKLKNGHPAEGWLEGLNTE